MASGEGENDEASNILDNAGRCLAVRLHRERTAHGWSLTELARRSGVSRAMVHRVERGESSPTAALLGRLSGAFGLTLSELLAEPGAAATSRLVRAEERAVWTDPDTGYRREQVVAGAAHDPAPGNGIDIVRVTLPPRTRIEFPAEAYAFLRQCVWVFEGRLRFEEGDVAHALGPGDCLALGAPAPCAFVNETDAACVYAVVVAPA